MGRAMADDIKVQAVAIAKLVNEGTAYVCGSWWTNGTIALKLPGALKTDQVLGLECQCGESGCGCDCAACSHCVDSTPYCDDVGKCPTLAVTWSDGGAHRPELMGKHLQGLITACVGLAGVPVTVGRKTVFRVGRCILVEHGQHASAGFRIHANLHYLAAARRYARASIWAFAASAGERQKAPILLGYRQAELVALVMPIDVQAACKEAA